MGVSAQTILDIGAFPGASDVEFSITGLSGIADASQVEAWIEPSATTDHSLDEHVVDPPFAVAYSPSAAGASMKIRLLARDSYPVADIVSNNGFSPPNNNAPLIYGKWNVGYAWA